MGERTNKPGVACEVSAERVVAARAIENSDAIDMVSFRTLSPGSLTPSLSATNIVQRDVLGQALADTLSTVAGRSKDVIAVLPDAAVRVVLLDFDTLPERQADADAVVRFRLKKALPFDVERAALSFQTHRLNGKVNVVAAVAQQSVLQEYEAAFRDAGYNPGVVLPSTVATLGMVDAPSPTMLLKVGAESTTLAIADHDQLLLYRVLENTGASVTAQQLSEDVYPSVVFLQDSYGLTVDRLLLAGATSPGEFMLALHAQTRIPVEELVPATRTGSLAPNLPPSALAGVMGALSA